MFGAQRTTNMNTPDAPFCIGCNDAELGQFPWQLSLQTTGHFCGGSILSATSFSTTAHCRARHMISWREEILKISFRFFREKIFKILSRLGKIQKRYTLKNLFSRIQKR